MNKLRMESPDLTAQNIDRIAALFPNCVTEMLDEERSTKEKKVYKRAINFELLKQMLSPDVVDGDEAYEFTWVGKKAAIVEANKPIRKTLRPCIEESKNWDSTENLYIEGDNLEVLKLLQESYLGKVKMIYIDPPYNTGNDFIYADDFMRSQEEENEQMGMFDEDENRLFKNTDTNGRFHSDWCSMIYSRLMLARNLLTDTGLIFVSIDDCELTNMRRICDEVFGESNFVDTIIWKKRYGGGAKEKWLVSLQEYVLVYCKNAALLGELYVPLTKDSIERYYQKKDENYATRGGYRTHPLEATKSMDARANLVYPIPAPDGSEIWPKRQWLWSKDRTYEALSKGELEIYQGNDGSWQVATKQYLRDADGTERLGKMFSIIENIYTQHGTNEMISLMGNAKIFPFPKPSSFVKQLLPLAADKDSIVLDFFSGSATTAHAVMQLNAEDGGHRKFIMVQLPEKCDETSEAYKAGYKNICEIGKERIRRAGEKIKAESPMTTQDLDIGFRVLKLDDTNMKDVYYAADDYSQDMIAGLESNIKDDRTDLDLLFGCLIDWGLPLSLPYRSEQMDGCTVHTYNGGDLIACFDANIPESVVKTIAKRKPLRAVFRDSGFASSPEKINVFEIFKLYMPEDAGDITKRVRVI
ncbi:MAG: site-specific DNA-methyltransferase [Christensenellales bacterium]|nr:site-specific DNA-methyltransferase [Christensenellales bacterium]